ncbi:hypothetical protein KP509_10G035300 [Ceratopteris richardii]|nr:hypothetical protein KP509_10G035300 [Ceratopteris richardii]
MPQRNAQFCGRSGGPGSGHARMYVPDASEDYWQDASVSIRPCHSWEAPPSAWLTGSSSSKLLPEDVNEERKDVLSDSGSPRIRSCRYSFDSVDCLCSPTRGRRSFPPPLASTSTLSFKGGGRFVLKEMDVDRRQGFFRALRENGRLVLQLVLPDEVDDEKQVADTAFDGDNDNTKGSKRNGEGEGEDHSGRSFACMGGGANDVTDILSNVGNGDSEEHLTNQSKGGDKGKVLDEMESGASCHADHAETRTRCDGDAVDVASAPVGRLEELAQRMVEVIGCSISACASTEGVFEVSESRMISESDSSLNAASYVEGTPIGGHLAVQDPVWNVDMPGHAMASLSSWPSEQLCLHHSIVSRTLSLGLAM